MIDPKHHIACICTKANHIFNWNMPFLKTFDKPISYRGCFTIRKFDHVYEDAVHLVFFIIKIGTKYS